MRYILTTSAILAALFVHLNAAVPWLEPVQTPLDLMAAVGFSPLPTEAPGLGSIPKELLRKQDQVPYPPPVNWCGFVGGNPLDVLSCSATKSCVYSGAVLGCCDAGAIQTCTNLFTTCANYGDTCNSACKANYNILKCPYDIPYCGTFAFDAGTRLYNCDSTQGAARSVEFLAQYYLTALGSQILSSFGPISITASDQVLSSNSRFASPAASSVRGTPISNVPIQSYAHTSTAVTDPNSTSHSGMSTGAIIGIVVGIVIVILAILTALIVWCCMRRRRRRQRTDPVPAPAPAPPMQQHQTQPQQTQPQQTQPQAPSYPPQQPTYPPQQPTYPPTQQSYFTAASDPIKPTFNNNTSTLPIPEADSTTPAAAGGVVYNDSKHDQGTEPPRYSVASAGGRQTPPPHLHGNAPGVGGGVLAPSSSDVPGAGDYQHQHPQPPHSPAPTEVEGSSLYGHGQGQAQRPGLGQGYSHGSGPISPLATGELGTGTGMQGQGQGGGFAPGQGAHEVEGYGRPVGGVGVGAGTGTGTGTGTGVGVSGPGQVQGGYGGHGVYEIGGGERRW